MADRPPTSSSLTTKALRKLARIAEAASLEAVQCKRVLTKLDLRRARECEALADHATLLAKDVRSWHDPDTPKERQVADAQRFQAVVQEAARLGLDA